MIEAVQEVPNWLDVTIAFMVLLGAFIVLIGNIGLVRLKSFYDRVHAPTLGATFGASLILFAAIFHFMESEKMTLVPLLILAFITLTTPVSLIMLVRAALFRDGIEKRPGIPNDD